MAMPTKKKRILYTVDDRVFQGLGYGSEYGATQLQSIVRRYAELIERAGREIEAGVVREEWNLMADVLSECADLWDYSEHGLSALVLIRAEVEDKHRLNKLGDQWFGANQGDRAVATLMGKLATMSPLQGEAIMAAIRFFWSCPEEIKHNSDPWWTVDFRLRRRRDAKVAAETK